jgi:hypothetical protein
VTPAVQNVDVELVELANTSEAVAAVSKQNDKVNALAEMLSRLPEHEIEPAIAFAVGAARQGRVGVGWATMADDGVQVSTRYPGGVALRFARVRQYRHNKRAGEADTI